jgi:hypothetical protein
MGHHKPRIDRSNYPVYPHKSATYRVIRNVRMMGADLYSMRNRCSNVAVGGLIRFSPPECRRPLANERINAMSDTSIKQTEEEILSYEVSDEALETAAGKEKTAAYTLYACTGLSTCPS